jgi:4-diphosphocytidyl-2-C-methyl-D-erythritol kinase
LNAHYQAGLTIAELAAVGAAVGSDVPFCVYGGLARVGGKGERVLPLDFRMPDCKIIIVKPNAWLSTKDVFARVAASQQQTNTTDAMIEALADGGLPGIAEALHNDLTEAALSLCPEIGDCLKALRAAGAMGVSLSGSGPSVFGIFPPEGTSWIPPLKRNWEVHTCSIAT